MKFRERHELVTYKLEEKKDNKLLMLILWLIYGSLNGLLAYLMYLGFKKDIAPLFFISLIILLYNIYAVLIKEVIVKIKKG